ncbi:MAG TPA: hypothetical protein VNL95_10150 [Dehalococcoidia bacterium]|nr:hypothetical protein [Dehalococcoidia bacterium]
MAHAIIPAAMADPHQVLQVARRIAQAVEREFPHARIEIDLDTPRDEHEDAYLWLEPGTQDEEELHETWAYLIKLVQDAYDQEDVYLVARVRGAVILRDRPADKE